MMNKKITVQKLLFTKKRVDVLKARLEDIKENNSVKDYDGFKAGMFSYMPQYDLFELYENDETNELREFIVDHFNKDSNEYNLEYHLQNVACVINQYFIALVHETNNIKPNSEVLTEDINGLAMVSETIDSVIAELEK